MRRLALILTLATGFVITPFTTEAQPAGKVYRVGWLATVRLSPGNSPIWDAFIAGLREGGWVEGQNLVIEPPLYRRAE